MKRKLSALLAIVLVVVMVFPTAIFVGADAPATFEVTRDGKAFNNAERIDLPKGVKTTLQINTTATIESVEIADNAVANLTWTNGSKTIELEGRLTGQPETTLTITYKEGENASQAYVIKVACHEPRVDPETVKVESITYESGGENKTSTDFVFNAGDVVTGAKVTAKLDTGASIETTNVKFGENAEKVTLKQSDNASDLAVVYTFDSVNDATTKAGTKNVRIFVNGYDVSGVRVEEFASPKKHTSTSISAADFESQYLTVYATIGGKEWGVPSGYKVEYFSSMTGTTKSTVTKIDSTNRDALYFEVVYENVRSERKAVSNYIDFNLPTPGKATVTLTNPSNSKYIAGSKLTVNEVTFSFEGIKSGDVVTVKDVEFTPFEYGKSVVYVSFTANGKKYTNEEINFAGIASVEEKTVVSIAESSKSKMKKTYTAGDKLDLSGLVITLTYNNGETEDLDYNVKGLSYAPINGKELTADDKNVRVSFDIAAGQAAYTDIAINVTANTKRTIVSADIVGTGSAKTSYFVGESFEKEGFTVLFVMSDTERVKVDLSKVTNLTISNNCYDNTNKKFTKTFDNDLEGVISSVTVSKDGVSYTGTNLKFEIPDIKVTKRPLLTGIVATTNKIVFMEGDAPRVCDFKITAKYDDNTQRVFEVDAETTGATKSTYTVTKDSVYYTVKLTPTMIDSDTKSIRVTYSEKTNEYGTKTYSDDIEIEVTVPDAILTYYDNTTGVKAYVSKAYEDFYEALKDAEKIADEYGSTYTSSYYSRVPEIQLRRDVTMSYDFDTTEDMKIDLNGHNLTMIRGELSVSTKAPTDTQVIFTNTADTDAKLIYSTSDDDTIIIAEDESFYIDRSTGSNKGKYDVTISSVKNGKVDGPREVTHGHDAKFTITPDEDYKIKSISVKEDKATKKYTEKDGVVTVEDVQGALTITVTFEEKAWDNPFTDVYKSATYYKSIQFVYENGLFSGMSATKFEPDTTMTRAMFVTVLGRLAGVDTSKYTKAPNFTDVSTTDQSISYAIPYIQWATDNGLITGYGNGKFGPKDNITHIQMYVLMQRYAGYIEHKNTSAASTSIPANDVSDIPTWAGAYEAVQYAAKNDFLVTSSNRITPNGDAKRSELAMLLEKFCANVLDWEK